MTILAFSNNRIGHVEKYLAYWLSQVAIAYIYRNDSPRGATKINEDA
jgi:hypothetical protein